MSQAILTFTVPQTETIPVAVNDVTQTRIAYPIFVDRDLQQAVFQYQEGKVVAGIFSQTSLSETVIISNATTQDFTNYVDGPVKDATKSAEWNLEAQLLQYLEDKNLISTGTIS